jgi:cold shock CspA family protein
MTARVQQFYDLKGYGFLMKDFRTRIFFHVSAWKSAVPPQVGMTVTFDLAPSKKPGMPEQAVNVTPLAGEEEKFAVGGAE